jgi:excisionase family DNA binding protein
MPPHEMASARYGLRRAVYSINETSDILSTSRPAIYDLVREGRLEMIKLGPKKSRIMAGSIVRLLDELRGIEPDGVSP